MAEASNQKIKFDPLDNNKEGSILVKLWRNILTETNYINAIEYLVNRYANKGSSSVKMVKKKTKSSMIKNVTSTEMTWKTFIDLIFNILNVKKMTISVKLQYPNGKESIHSVVVEDTNVKHDIDLKEILKEK